MNMSADFPRGLQQVSTVATGGGIGAALSGIDAGSIAALVAGYLGSQSPKLMGNILYGSGRAAGKANELLGKLPSKTGLLAGKVVDSLVARDKLPLGPLAENVNNPDDKFNLIPQAIINYNKSKGLLR